MAANDLAGIGRTNDAVLYGGEATLWVRGDDDSLLEAAIDEAIARKPKGHDFVIDRRRKRPSVGRHMSVTGG